MQAIKACHESVRTDNVRFETDLVREQERFKDEVAAYAKEAQSFVRLGPCAPQQVEEYARLNSMEEHNPRSLVAFFCLYGRSSVLCLCSCLCPFHLASLYVCGLIQPRHLILPHTFDSSPLALFLSPARRYATQQENLLEKLRAAETLVASFNKREELFNIPVTDYSELDLIRQDFEPYAALWNMAFVFQVLSDSHLCVYGRSNTSEFLQ